MTRREFGSLLASAAAAYAAPAGNFKITAIELIELRGEHEAEAGVNGQRQVNPLDIYDEQRPAIYKDNPRGTRKQLIKAIYLVIHAGDSLFGEIAILNHSRDLNHSLQLNLAPSPASLRRLQRLRKPGGFLHQLALRIAEGAKVGIERSGGFGPGFFEFPQTMLQLFQRDFQRIFLLSKKDGERDARNETD